MPSPDEAKKFYAYIKIFSDLFKCFNSSLNLGLNVEASLVKCVSIIVLK